MAYRNADEIMAAAMGIPNTKRTAKAIKKTYNSINASY